jgi:CubicO group peptidase (beta-lactamase class C family)
MQASIPDWVTYPEHDWEETTAEEAGFDRERWLRFTAQLRIGPAWWEGEAHGPDEFGIVLARGGRVVRTWGDGDYRFQTASVGKAFTRVALGLAAERGLLDPDQPIHRTWTGAGSLSHPHKHLDRGHHVSLTWNHLVGLLHRYAHCGGFPVTNGFLWRKGPNAQSPDEHVTGIPSWSVWTGDPFYDNYSHAEPGTVEAYSSGGLWRLSQALTFVWGRSLKDVLDEYLFSRICIEPNEWDWLPGRLVRETRDFYPHMPGYGDFIDPPYEIGGCPVVGGGGWVVMSAKNLARFGHLVATGGMWKGERLVGAKWLRSHHGGNGSFAGGESLNYTAMGRVTASSVPFPLPEELFARPAAVCATA